MNEVLLISTMAAVTFSMRYFMFAAARWLHFPHWLNGLLQFVPPVILTAIIAPMILMPAGQVSLNFNNAYLWAAVGATSIGYWRQDLLSTVIPGMVLFVIWNQFMA